MTDDLFDLTAAQVARLDAARGPVLAFQVAVRDRPAPQGSKRPFTDRRTGQARMKEMSTYLKPWRTSVRDEAYAARRAADPLDGPLWVEMVFTAVRPRSHYRTGRNAHLLRADAPVQPMTAPDLSKLARSTEDALTAAGVWRDDARVAEYRRLAKVWAGEDPDALDVPGVVIRIYALGAPT